MKCEECNSIEQTLYEDPRNPPLDEEPCLCNDCYINAVNDRIDELESELESLRSSKRLLHRGPMRWVSP